VLISREGAEQYAVTMAPFVIEGVSYPNPYAATRGALPIGSRVRVRGLTGDLARVNGRVCQLVY
jgi:hypothetical protein